MLLLGTYDGVHRLADPDSTETAELVLECGRVVELWNTDVGVYAATRNGLYFTSDQGDSWQDLDVPLSDVWSVHPTDDRLYAGCYPASMFVSIDKEHWEEIESLYSAERSHRWWCPGDDDNGRVRSIRTDPGRTDRLLVGVEVGGLYISDDLGGSWTRHLDTDVVDIHHINVVGPDEYFVCVGQLDLDHEYTTDGVFKTTNGGESWTRLDMGEHSYVRETLVYDGVLYVSGALETPIDWVGADGAKAMLFESTDNGETMEPVPYPSGGKEIVISWAVDDGYVYGGTANREYDEGRLIRRDEDGWVDIGFLPTNIFSMVSL